MFKLQCISNNFKTAFELSQKNNEEKTLCSVTLIYHPFSQAMMENLREKIDENIACLNMKCRAQLLEDLLLLPEFREKLVTTIKILLIIEFATLREIGLKLIICFKLR